MNLRNLKVFIRKVLKELDADKKRVQGFYGIVFKNRLPIYYGVFEYTRALNTAA